MNKNLDTELKVYFSHKEDVPQEVRIALEAKLRAAQTNEKLPWVWLMAPCMLVVAVLMLGIIDMFVGRTAAVILGIAYYAITLMGGAVVVVTLLTFKKATSALQAL